MNPTVALPGSMTWMGIRLSSGSRRPQSSKGFPLHVLIPCKTEVSRKPIPMNPEIADMLWRWRLETPYNKPGDWIFASPHKAGIQPYWPGSLFRAHVKPGASESGHFCAGRLAQTTAQLCNLDESQWRRPQDHPKIAAPCNIQSHSTYLHAIGHATETCRANTNREAY